MIKKKKVITNAGFSMIELIVVITIMAIMIGGSIVGIGLLGSGNSKKAIKNISSQLAELRTNTLSVAGVWSAEIYLEDNSYMIDIMNDKFIYVDVTIGGVTEKVKEFPEPLVSSTSIGSKIEISYKDSVKVLKKLDDENNKLVISFEQGSGKIKAVNLVRISDDTVIESLIGTDSKSGDIIVTVNSSSMSTSLALWYLTGKITTEY